MGGGTYIYGTKSETEMNNVKIIDNKTIQGSGGGIYAYGNLNILGNDTVISNNTANTYGGGMIVKTKATLNAGEISNNSTSRYAGGGISVDGELTMNGGTIKNNSANTTGGGIYYTNGVVYLNSGIIENNKATIIGNEVYPVNDITVNVTSNMPEGWTNKNIDMIITASSQNIKTVTINGETLAKQNNGYTYTVTQNGTYQIIVTDNIGNTAVKEFTITNIDKESPVVTGVVNNGTYHEDITINAKDVLSGIKNVKVTKNGTQMQYTLGQKITESGTYTIIVEDNVANTTTLVFTIDKSLKEDDIVIEGISNDWTNQNQTIKITVEKEVKSVKINGQEVTLTNGIYSITATNNTYYMIEITNLDGTTITKPIQISNIDKNAPIIYGIVDGQTYSGKVSLIVRDGQSGISSIIVTKDGQETIYTNNEIQIEGNGTYQIKAVDNVGNEKILKFKIETNPARNDDDMNKEKDQGNDEIIKGEDNIQDFEENGGIQEILEEEKDTTVSNLIIPNAGVKSLMIGLVVLFICSLLYFIKLRSYKDIK